MFYLAFTLIRLTIKLTIAMVILSLWATWAVIAVPLMLIASACGDQRAARQWQRSMRWLRRAL